MAVLKMRPRQSHLFCISVHQINKSRLTAGNVLRNRNRRIVARRNHNTSFKLRHRHRLPRLNPHQRRALEHRVLRPGIPAHGHHIIKTQATELDFLSQNVGGHQLGQAGGRQLQIRIVLDQHRARVKID